MPVSASGANLSVNLVRRLATGFTVLFCLFAYFYGPAAAPAMRAAAASECNDYAEGDFRSFRLSWDVGALPHWSCWDASRPARDPVSLGWWTDPFA